MSRVTYYYQTFPTTGLQCLLPPHKTPCTHLLLSAVHFGFDGTPSNTAYIHLNDHDPSDPCFDAVWADLAAAAAQGMVPTLMVGGAGGAFQTLFAAFDTFYPLLRDLLRARPLLRGVDLDIEETVAQADVEMLVARLDHDFGPDFLLTMAPVASSLLSPDEPGMGGFAYGDLSNTWAGRRVNWFHVQCYGGGELSLATIDQMVANGFAPARLCAGVMPGDYGTAAAFDQMLHNLREIVAGHPDFGGVFVWEFADSGPPAAPTDPAAWAAAVGAALVPAPCTKPAIFMPRKTTARAALCAILCSIL
jgi:hypothetical protein